MHALFKHFAARKALILLTVLALPGCTLHKISESYKPEVILEYFFSPDNPAQDTEEETEDKTGPVRLADNGRAWFEQFDNQDLNNLMGEAFAGNLGLKESWARLRQADLSARIAGANLWPGVTGNVTPQGNERRNETGEDWDDSLSMGASLSWEIDLWGKIRAERGAAIAEAEATAEDFKNTALLLSGSVARAYFDIVQQQALEKLLRDQITTNQQFLELTSLRKAVGQGTILDVKQQQQQLLQVEAEIPTVSERRESAEHILAVLGGLSPVTYNFATGYVRLPAVPALPTLGSPRDLLENSPEIRAAYERLKAADFEIAERLADRLPSLTITSSYTVSSETLGGSLESMLLNITGSLVQTIFDAGEKRFTEQRARAAFEEQLYAFTRTYLEVIQDVEDALTAEKYSAQRLKNLERQVALAKDSLVEAQFQYGNGLVDYRTVLNALETLQTRERQLIAEQRTLIDARIDLHMALGSTIHDDENFRAQLSSGTLNTPTPLLYKVTPQTQEQEPE